MTTTDTTLPPATARFWPSGVAIVAALILLGQRPGGVALLLRPNAAEAIGLTAVPVPVWLFIAVWPVIYAGIGIAAWQLWQQRHALSPSASVPLIVLAVGFVQSTLSWFTDSLLATAVTDATGLLLAVAATAIVRAYSRVAARWLLPWLIWMPLTFAIKIATILNN